MDMPNLKKYMKKKGMEEDPGELGIKAKPQFEPAEVEGHDDISTDAFETPDTDDDPLEDHSGPDSATGMTALQRYQKLKAKG